jgi:hypothetical protein
LALRTAGTSSFRKPETNSTGAGRLRHAVTPQLFSSAGAFAMGDMLLPRRRNPHTLSKSLAFGILLFLDQSGTNLVNFLTHCNRIWKPDFRFDL